MSREMLVDVAGLIQTAGLATSAADLFGYSEPDSPDNSVTLFESTGLEPERTMSGIAQEVLNLQVLVRNTSATAGKTKMDAIFNVLDRYKGTITGTTYFSILARHSPISIGRDENRRHKWSCNFRVNRSRP